MKHLSLLVAVLCATGGLVPYRANAQAPEKISYQAIVRTGSGELVTNTTVSVKISIQKFYLGIPPSYQSVYVETHSTPTNENGLITIKIGGGTVVDGQFANIDWSDGTYFLKTETDPSGGTNYTIAGSTQLLSVPYALFAKSTKTYKIGEFSQGGVVFWVDETGQHGLVCAITDQSSGVRWCPGTYGNTQAKGDGPFAGEANTAIIIAAHAAIGDDGNTYAARICNELQVTQGRKSYGDWYLPSITELSIMYQNKATIDATATANGGSNFADAYYWSSTETTFNTVLVFYFHSGGQYEGLKNIPSGKVRAVRAF